VVSVASLSHRTKIGKDPLDFLSACSATGVEFFDLSGCESATRVASPERPGDAAGGGVAGFARAEAFAFFVDFVSSEE
jgi:hypothetical protein